MSRRAKVISTQQIARFYVNHVQFLASSPVHVILLSAFRVLLGEGQGFLYSCRQYLDSALFQI